MYKKTPLPIEDFDTHLPPAILTLVQQNDFYWHYLAERKRIGDMTAEHVANGGSLSDPKIIEEHQRLNALAIKVNELIQDCKQN